MTGKIATITTHAALNYGAVLQAYALQQTVLKMGHPCDVLNYVPDHVRKSYRLVQMPHRGKDVLLSAFQLLHYKERKVREERFAMFRKEHLQLSGEVISTHEALVKAANQYDLVLCGSDQIWNPALHEFDEAYFLSFPEVSTARASYGASFGQDRVPPELEPELRRRLSGFSAFGARENSGKALLERLTGAQAELVLDPVFLLPPEHWRQLITPVEGMEQSVLVYFLSNPGQSPLAAKKYAAAHGAEAVSIGFSPRDVRYGMAHRYDLGPQEFLCAVSDAKVILTNSFHCAAFAILMEKDFYVRLNAGSAARNDRIVTLLGQLGLEERAYFDEDAQTLDFEKPIDYAAVRPRLAAAMEASGQYLNSVLMEK